MLPDICISIFSQTLVIESITETKQNEIIKKYKKITGVTSKQHWIIVVYVK